MPAQTTTSKPTNVGSVSPGRVYPYAVEFQLHGPELHVVFGTSGKGDGVLIYQDAQHSLRFSAKEIQAAPTSIGSMLTVTISESPSGSAQFTLILPDGYFPIGFNEAPIRTYGFTSTSINGLGGPDFGQKHFHTISQELTGSALLRHPPIATGDAPPGYPWPGMP